MIASALNLWLPTRRSLLSLFQSVFLLFHYITLVCQQYYVTRWRAGEDRFFCPGRSGQQEIKDTNQPPSLAMKLLLIEREIEQLLKKDKRIVQDDIHLQLKQINFVEIVLTKRRSSETDTFMTKNGIFLGSNHDIFM